MDFITNLFKKPSATELAREDMEESEREAIKHAAAASYHEHMAQYHQKNVDKLRLMLTKARY